ncbi:MAG: hypothetical protein QOI49_1600 [Verrucomicrobiota bacterium]
MRTAELKENDPPPADDTQLALMHKIVSRNMRAMELLNALWEYFGGRMKCEVIRDDGNPSVINYNPCVVNGKEAPDCHLILRENERLEEALVHELLHADLWRRGYPRWFLRTQAESLWNQGRDILNLAEHIVMLPTFKSLGYPEERFVGPSKPLDEEGRQVLGDLAAMADLLSTPKGFVEEISAYLQARGIQFEVPCDSATGIRHEN